MLRRHRTVPLVSPRPDGSGRYHFLDAGWLEVSQLCSLHVVLCRKGRAHPILGLVTDTPELSAAGLIQTYEKRWTIEQIVKDAKQLLELDRYQNRPYRAAIIHLHLVCFAYALLTHLRLRRHGAQGQWTHEKAVGMSVAVVQEALRLVWDDMVAYLKEQHHGQAVIAELDRLRVA